MKKYVDNYNGCVVKTFLSWTDSDETRKEYPGLRSVALCHDGWFWGALNAIRDSSSLPGGIWYSDSIDIYGEVEDLRPATADEIEEYLEEWSISDEEREDGFTAVAWIEDEYGTHVVFKYTWKDELRDQIVAKSPRFILKLLEKIGLLRYERGRYVWYLS